MITTHEINPSHRPARLLAKHIDIISHAIRHNKAIIDNTDDQQKLIKDLSNANLGSYIKAYNGLLLHTTVLRFVRFHEGRGRALASGKQLGVSIEGIYKAVETYQIAYQERLADDDKDLVKQELFEALSYFSGILIDLAHKFSVQVYEDIERYTSLKMRLRYGEQALGELSNINDLLEGLNTATLLDIGLEDPQIDEYISILLLPAKNYCLDVLIDSAHKLNTTLLKIRQDIHNQRTHSLIQAFLRVYKNKPHYQPDPTILAENFKPFLMVSQPIQGYMDLNDIESQAIWQDIIAKLPTNNTTQPAIEKSETVTTVSELIEEIPSFLYEAVESTFLLVQQHATQLVASQVFANIAESLALENVDMATWLLTVAKFYQDHRSEFPEILLAFEEQILPNYTGNRQVTDLVLRHQSLSVIGE